MIEVEHAVRLFGSFRAVDDISFSIQKGEIVGLLGPNGAGKTTTMRMISCFLEPTSGSIKIDGLDVTKNPVEVKRKIGYMPESAPLYSDMIVADYLSYISEMYGLDPKEKLPALAQICGLKEQMHKNIADLSRGNRQRVGLAHALMSDPEILILDEPTGGLDPNQVAEVRSLIKEIGKTRTVIISTHILSEVEALCDRVIIISQGKKVADSPTEALREQSGNKAFVLLTVGGAEESELLSACVKVCGGAAHVTIQKHGDLSEVSISVNAETEIRPALAKLISDSGWELYSLSLKKNSLEDVFKQLTQNTEKSTNENK